MFGIPTIIRMNRENDTPVRQSKPGEDFTSSWRITVYVWEPDLDTGEYVRTELAREEVRNAPYSEMLKVRDLLIATHREGRRYQVFADVAVFTAK